MNSLPISTSSLTGYLSPHSRLLSNGATAASNFELYTKLVEWQVFINCFGSAVHSNLKLNDINQMKYLKSLLEGPVAAALKGLSLTSENYK